MYLVAISIGVYMANVISRLIYGQLQTLKMKSLDKLIYYYY